MRLRQIQTAEEANRFLREYLEEFNRRFAVEAAEKVALYAHAAPGFGVGFSRFNTNAQ